MGELQVIPILTALGVGSIVTAAVQSYLGIRRERAARSADEKKEAFIGLLTALQRANLHQQMPYASTGEASESLLEFAYWQLRCDLVASGEVRTAISDLKEAEEHVQRGMALDRLISAMRADLGIAG